MTFDEYQELAMRTKNKLLCDKELMTNAVLGLNGEAGEAADILKKSEFQGHEFDEDEFVNEIGDILWYCALAAESMGKKLSEFANKNVTKLEKRYKNGFTVEESVNRSE